jgi:hypothetical protein
MVWLLEQTSALSLTGMLAADAILSLQGSVPQAWVHPPTGQHIRNALAAVRFKIVIIIMINVLILVN